MDLVLSQSQKTEECFKSKPMLFNQLAKSALILMMGLAVIARSLPRDKTERDRFVRSNPCPANGNTKGPCPGYEVDHKKALMNGGKDKPDNMQWRRREEHKEKTKQDFEQCKMKSAMCKHRGLRGTNPSN